MTKKNAQPSKKKTPAEIEWTPEYRETFKFTRWCQYFMNKKSPIYGNATQCALKVYDTENYWSAARIGYENSKKLKNLGVSIVDMEGFGFAELMKIGIGKMVKGGYQDWDNFMVRLGHFENKPNVPVAMQFNFGDLGSAINKDREERGLKPL